jgi:hypothetical protein
VAVCQFIPSVCVYVCVCVGGVPNWSKLSSKCSEVHKLEQ